jgi:hypothetical protein
VKVDEVTRAGIDAERSAMAAEGGVLIVEE